MTVKFDEMENLVSPEISIDQYIPKVGEANETVVVAFFVNFEQAAKDLSNLLETDITPLLDVDMSPGPDPDGKYIVFVEFNRDKQLHKKIMRIIDTVSRVTGIESWTFRYFKGQGDTLPLTLDNLHDTVIDNKKKYVLKYGRKNGNETKESNDIERIKKLAGLTRV